MTFSSAQLVGSIVNQSDGPHVPVVIQVTIGTDILWLDIEQVKTTSAEFPQVKTILVAQPVDARYLTRPEKTPAPDAPWAMTEVLPVSSIPIEKNDHSL